MSDGVRGGVLRRRVHQGLCVNPSHHEAHQGIGERDDWDPLARVYLARRDNLPSESISRSSTREPPLPGPGNRQGCPSPRLSWGDAIRAAVLRGPAYAVIIVDGRTISSGQLPTPDEAIQLVRDALGLRVT
jgi:hypothetical protein